MKRHKGHVVKGQVLNPKGRTGYGQELNLVQKYNNLSEGFFRELKNALESPDKRDRYFAINTLKGAFEKMLPQTIEADVKIEAVLPESEAMEYIGNIDLKKLNANTTTDKCDSEARSKE